MTRKWFTMLFLVAAAAACAETGEDELELEGMDAEEQTVPSTPAQPMDTSMMSDTMMMDTAGVDTMGM